MGAMTPPTNKEVVWASGLAPAATGVGVFQRHMYPILARDFAFEVRLGPSRERRRLTLRTSGKDILNFGAQLAVAARGDVAFLTTTPTPLSVPIPTVGVVYDLRWLRTRSAIARFYRRTDLARLVRLSTSLVAISDRTLLDLESLFPEAHGKTHVVPLGPGNVGADSFTAGEVGTVLLIGDAPYKRNELAASALAAGRPSWAKRFLGLSVSTQVKQTLEAAFGVDNCEWFSNLSQAGVEGLYQRAETFVNLSLEEGFGLPFIEALAAGANVVAIRQTLTDVLLAESAILLADGGVDRIASQIAGLGPTSWPPALTRRARAASFSWEAAASKVAQLLRSAGATRTRTTFR